MVTDGVIPFRPKEVPEQEPQTAGHHSIRQNFMDIIGVLALVIGIAFGIDGYHTARIAEHANLQMQHKLDLADAATEEARENEAAIQHTLDVTDAKLDSARTQIDFMASFLKNEGVNPETLEKIHSLQDQLIKYKNQISYEQDQLSSTQAKLRNAQQKLTSGNTDQNDDDNQYNGLVDEYNSLLKEYNALVDEYNNLSQSDSDRYNALVARFNSLMKNVQTQNDVSVYRRPYSNFDDGSFFNHPAHSGIGIVP
jgi:chromosome segregation ATPase